MVWQGIVYSYFMPVWGKVKTAAPRCRGLLDALLAERPKAMVHQAVHGTKGAVVLSVPPNSHEITFITQLMLKILVLSPRNASLIGTRCRYTQLTS